MKIWPDPVLARAAAICTLPVLRDQTLQTHPPRGADVGSPLTCADVYLGEANGYFAVRCRLRSQPELLVISFSQLQKAVFGERIRLVSQHANQSSAPFNKLFHYSTPTLNANLLNPKLSGYGST